MVAAEQVLERANQASPAEGWAAQRWFGAETLPWRRSRYAVREPLRPAKPLVGGDARRGEAMLRGEFDLGGLSVQAVPASVFRLPAPSSAWRDALAGLVWLKHLAATPHELAVLTARSLLIVWFREAGRKLSVRQQAKALTAIAFHGEFLLRGAGSDFRAAFDGILATLARRMERRFIETAETALAKAIALSHAALAFQLGRPVRDGALAELARSIDKLVLPDGGHAGRSPLLLLQLALDLIPLQRALRDTHVAVPRELDAALERMLPMLRLLSHEDGGLTGLQDGSQADGNAVRAVLAADASRGRPLAIAPYAGFGKLAYNGGNLLMDTGADGPCRSPLAFEFSDGPQRIIVSCGRPIAESPAWQAALASPAAHSTWDMDRDLAMLAPATTAESVSSPQGGLLHAAFSARGTRRRASHDRRLFLSASGCDLRGEDHVRLEGAGPQQCCLRFHLHPAVDVAPLAHPNCLSLRLPQGDIWIFSQAGGTIAVEDSIYCKDGGEPGPSRQIVVRSAAASGLDVHWSIRREKTPVHR